MGRHLIASIALLTAAVYWAVWLFLSPSPWSEESAVVLGAGLVLAAAIAVAGLLIEHSRLAYRLGWSIVVVVALVALIHPLDTVWIVGVVITSIAALSMTDRNLGGWIRSEPPVAPVPKSAVALALILLSAPVVAAIVTLSAEARPLPWLALTCWTVLFCYVRRLPGALAVVRFGLPLLAAAAWWLPLEGRIAWPGRIAWIAMIAVGAGLAWTSTTRLAIRPLIERGTKILIPPELVPEEIRRSAGIDQKDK